MNARNAAYRAIASSGKRGATVDHIIWAVYGADPHPASARETIRTIVRRLRKSIDSPTRSLVTVRCQGQPTAYRIERSDAP